MHVVVIPNFIFTNLLAVRGVSPGCRLFALIKLGLSIYVERHWSFSMRGFSSRDLMSNYLIRTSVIKNHIICFKTRVIFIATISLYSIYIYIYIYG